MENPWKPFPPRSAGSLTLDDYPADIVRLACRRCNRKGQYRKDRLIAEHGAAARLPDLRRVIAADCPRWRESGTTCGIYYVDLVAED